MSNENAQMDPATAEAVILEGIYVPAFVEKCASLGVTFPDEDSLVQALKTSLMLKSAEAEESTDLVKDAHDALLGVAGVESPEVVAEMEAERYAEVEKAASVANYDVVRQALAALRAQE